MVDRTMSISILFLLAVAGCMGVLNSTGLAQEPSWRAPSGTAAVAPPSVPTAAGSQSPAAATNATPVLTPVTRMPRKNIAKVTSGAGTLPNEDGQIWREYDIAPYTTRVTTTNTPEQAIVDWILRETGYEAWHSEPLGLLSANRRVLRVYHTPQMQELVADIVDRFVNSDAETHAFGLRIVTVESPNWRAKSVRMLRPIPVQTQGVQAWLVAKEDAALLVGDLRKRSDFREHSSPHLLVNNGQSTVVSATRPRNYIRDVLVRGDTWPGFEPQVGQVLEGFSMEMSPLLSVDTASIDAVIKCNIDHVEKLVPVVLDVPTAAAPRQRTQMDVPQIISTRLHERFRWPADQVLLISLGVVPSPVPIESGVLRLPLATADNRADLLLFVESKGTAVPGAATTETAQQQAPTYRGRY